MPESNVIYGDCIERLAEMEPNTIDAIVTDPPYGIGIIEEEWDTFDSPQDFQNFCRRWAEQVLRVAKPGAFLVSFCASRTVHRMASGIEDAGFTIRDQGIWLYRSGHPKNRNAGTMVDAHLGVDHHRKVVGTARMNDTTKSRAGFTGLTSEDGRTHTRDVDITEPYSPMAKMYDGWSHTLKPCLEPWVLARKPLAGTVAENLLRYGTGVMNIPGCTIDLGDDTRYPPNVLTEIDEAQFDVFRYTSAIADYKKANSTERPYDSDAPDKHVTVKPVDLMRYVVRLVTPPGGTVLDPFSGSGTTLEAANIEGYDAIGIELNEERYRPLIEQRLGRPTQFSLGI